jgi:cytochrome c peroxidase
MSCLIIPRLLILLSVLLASEPGLRSQPPGDSTQAYAWDLPKGFPKPRVPADNPMTAAKVELGRHLFYDKRMSVNGRTSCATCHKQELAFADDLPVGVGTTGEKHSRNSMGLVNIAYNGVLTWSNPQMRELEDQAAAPMFGTHPVELGLREGEGFFITYQRDPKYRVLVARAFPGDPAPYSTRNIQKAIACFERSIISARSPYDRYHYGGDEHAVSDSAKRGEVLYFSRPLACFQCHGGFNFSNTTVSEREPQRRITFHNTGVYNVPGTFSYPAANLGIYEHTKDPTDVGKFKATSLRNIALTAPYMHDGSLPTLEAVIDHYAAGGRTLQGGPNRGVGHDNPNKDPLINGFPLSKAERDDLLAFLKSLTDQEVLKDARFADPWVEGKP